MATKNGCLNQTFSNMFSETDIIKIFNNSFKQIEIDERLLTSLIPVFKQAHNEIFTSYRHYDKFMLKMRRQTKYNIMVSKSSLYKHYVELISRELATKNYNLEKFMRTKGARSRSGVISVTIFTSGYLMGSEISENAIKRGGCPMDCHYCPLEVDSSGNPTQPRSYLSTEPGNKRATENKHHPFGQVLSRLHQLEAMGHVSSNSKNISKIELIISGGTFNFYPREYIIWFTTCAYYACNTYYNVRNSKGDFSSVRVMRTLEYEKNENESSSLRIIGLTVETRPDYVTPSHKNYSGVIDFSQIELFRLIGTTRVQVGVQSTNDDILRKINRKCTSAQNKEGIRRLKQNGFKTDIHIMYDLPGSTAQIDKQVIDEIVDHPDYQADQWKLYPTETVNFSVVKKWYDEGTYVPYAEDHSNGTSYQLVDVIQYSMSRVPEYIRINRVVRDIPHISIEGGLKCSNLRQLVKKKMDKQGLRCRDIREREVKHQDIDIANMIMDDHIYMASGGEEHFIQFCSKDKEILYGFIRLRLNSDFTDCLRSLYGCALIRELHVYGQHTNLGHKHKGLTQHKGLGTKLLMKAERIAKDAHYETIAVISGVGVREYYRKKGYVLGPHDYMYKSLIHLDSYNLRRILGIFCLLMAIVSIGLYWYL